MSEASAVTLSLVIPVFNEAESLPALFSRIDGLMAGLPDVRIEVLLVDDHSQDDSPALIKAACARYPAYRYLRLAHNSGSHIAILAGLEQAEGRCAVFLAADLQDPPELVCELLARWRDGYHVVWAVREQRDDVPPSDILFANAFYWLINRFSNITLPPKGSDFVLVDRVVIEALRRSVSAQPYLMGEISRLGFRQTSVQYRKEARRFGKTKWNIERKLRLFADAFVGFSYSPLRLMSYLGLVFSLLGLSYAVLIVALKLLGNRPVQGWASLMVVLLVIGGFQMTMLGVLGEYLWRVLEEARNRPSYFIEEQCGGEPPERP